MPVTLIVEDGTRPLGANTYISYADAITYITVYKQNSANYASLTLDNLTVPLIRAARALDEMYGVEYNGELYSYTQPLLFPRGSFFDRNGRFHGALTIPIELQHAQVELAILIYDGVDPRAPRNAERNVLSKTVNVADAIATSITYSKPNDDDEQYTGLLTVERLIAPILKDKSRKVRFHL